MRLLFIISTSFFLSGCVVITEISHDFKHYGTDALRTNSEFFYVKQSASGSATISYNFNKYGQHIGGGDIKKGCVADAKSALAKNMPLGSNQAYTNMSIDITKAERRQHYKGLFGTISQYGKIQKITYNTVVSADIIEYGGSPLNKEFPSPSSGSMDELTVNNEFPSLSSGSMYEITVNNKLGQLELYEGQKIRFKDIDQKIYPAIVLSYNPSRKSYEIRIQKEGEEKIKSVLPGSYRRIIQ